MSEQPKTDREKADAITIRVWALCLDEAVKTGCAIDGKIAEALVEQNRRDDPDFWNTNRLGVSR